MQLLINNYYSDINLILETILLIENLTYALRFKPSLGLKS